MKWKFTWKSVVESLNRPGRAALARKEQSRKFTAIKTQMTNMKEKFQANDLDDMPEIMEEIEHDFSKFTQRDNNRYEDSDDDMGEVA
jgi:archaellum component FlaC